MLSRSFLEAVQESHMRFVVLPKAGDDIPPLQPLPSKRASTDPGCEGTW